MTDDFLRVVLEQLGGEVHAAATNTWDDLPAAGSAGQEETLGAPSS